MQVRKGRNICRIFIGIAAFVLIAVGSLSLSGCGVVKRVKYEFSGSGEEGWDHAAIESGIVTGRET